jgi:tRNA1(Val) A37 N6-methylase TrmN6
MNKATWISSQLDPVCGCGMMALLAVTRYLSDLQAIEITHRNNP